MRGFNSDTHIQKESESNRTKNEEITFSQCKFYDEFFGSKWVIF
jgi:hypothetical protein